MSKAAAIDAVESDRDRIRDVATAIWERPELGLEETYAADRLRSVLADAGFEIESGIAGMETAFVARYGTGDPVIGTIGEYDALPGLSQRRSATREPTEEGAPGHGCGHNLFGTASAFGAIGAKRGLEAADAEGTVVFFGTPAEELAIGKPFMLQAGAFEDVDAVVSWHPGWFTGASKGSCLAVDDLRFEFTGTASHAAAAPDAGRSALDAVQLLNTGVEYMREHVPEAARIHYAIENAGSAPNVVDPEASVEYFVRAPDRDTVEEIADWVREIAAGAATMTQTEVTVEYRGGTYDVLSNHAIADAIAETMADLGGFEVPSDDRDLAAELKASLDGAAEAVDRLPEEHRGPASEAAMYTEPVEPFDAGSVGSYSTDVGDVSWNVPVGRFRAATWPVGTPAHSWQAVAASGSAGLHAAVYAAKVIAGTMADLLTDEALLESAIAEFEAETAGIDYDPPLPEGATPHDLAAE